MNIITQILFLPFLGFMISALFAMKSNVKLLHYLNSILILISTILAFKVFANVVFAGDVFTVYLLSWFDVGNLKIDWRLRVDVLSAVMIVVVTTVSTVVHFYSMGYMEHDKKTNRFMSYLSLFTFFMLILVTSDNLVQMFVGWEGVGLCSYLLIGFWYKKDSANNAALKAFIMNRVGDFAFIIGIMAIFILFDTVTFGEIFLDISLHTDKTITLLGTEINYIDFICISLFIGCMGKSAQIGLHNWLPDAMEGPTPVSALIHAATMVTAGVFLIVRLSPLFEQSQIALNLITFVGALTCIFAATVAIVQNDIKKVIAYSTCSQLGYMFFACGVSAYSAGMFHLVTHAFFKALLFLTAGNVIVALHHEQDMRKMGGLWRKIPLTYIMVWIGSLAIAGVPPFAGYYSKDIILEAAYMSGSFVGNISYTLGVITAFLTAFYSWRLIYMVFHGKAKGEHKLEKISMVMSLPLLVLVVGALFSGYVGYNLLEMASEGNSFWKGAIMVAPERDVLHKIHDIPLIMKYLPLIAALSGVIFATIYYKFSSNSAMPNNLRAIYNFLLNKWYFDKLYAYIFVRGFKNLGKFSWKTIDILCIDTLGPNGMVFITKNISKLVSRIQNGLIYHYSFVMIIGIVFFFSWFLVKLA